MAVVAGDEAPLFDVFLLVNLDEIPVDNYPGVFTRKASVSYLYPPDAKNDKDDIFGKVLSFCYPEGYDFFGYSSEYLGESFSFVITKSDSTKKFAYCRRVLHPGSSEYQLPRCYCFLTDHPWISLYENILSNLEKSEQHSREELELFLKYLFKADLPKPGGFATITLPPTSFSPGPQQFRRPSEETDLEPLFQQLDGEQILALFASLLFERHIILASNSLAVVSSCVRSAGGLLHPFVWEHIFIPVLPSVLLDFATAPMPFLIGMHSSCVPHLKKMHLEDSVVIIEIDTRSVMFFQDDVETMPTSAMNRLLRQLTKATSRFKKSGVFNQAHVQKAVLQFFSTIFGDYPRFMRKEGGLDIEKWLLARNLANPEYRPFLETYLTSQMCEQFVKKLERKFRDGHESSVFEEMLLLYSDQSQTKKDKARELTSKLGDKGQQYAGRLGKKAAELRKKASGRHVTSRDSDRPNLEDENQKTQLLKRLSAYKMDPLVEDPEAGEQLLNNPQLLAYAAQPVYRPRQNSNARNTSRVVLTALPPEEPRAGAAPRHREFVQAVERLRAGDSAAAPDIAATFLDELSPSFISELPNRADLVRDLKRGDFASLHAAQTFVRQFIAKADLQAVGAGGYRKPLPPGPRRSGETKSCVSCNESLSLARRFCFVCGARQDHSPKAVTTPKVSAPPPKHLPARKPAISCRNCSSEIPANVLACLHCAEPREESVTDIPFGVCVSCNLPIVAKRKFCTHCGVRQAPT